jgi:three-Cys-motif partner protein
LLVIRAAILDAKLAPALRTYFNDRDIEKADCLREEFARLGGLDKLSHRPLVFNEEASIEFVEGLHLDAATPKLFFLDPFGYKALTMPLLRSVLEGWSECIFFFNYRRVIAALNNPAFKPNVERLFGVETLKSLKLELAKTKSVLHRESLVLKHLTSALVDAGAEHVMNFSFKVEDAQRSTHHLIFVTGHRKGFEAMKTIMARESSRDTEDGPSMTFTQQPAEPTLFDRNPHEVLGETLMKRFQSQTISLDNIYEEMGAETPFTQPYFRRSLLLLEQKQEIEVDPPATSRPSPNGKQSMSGSTMITFPERTT